MPQSALRGKAGHHMLENLDLDMWMDQAEWDAVSGELKKKLGVLQQRARALKIPTVIVFEGWGASGKGDKLSRLITNLDPRGFSVHSITAPSTDERRYPWMKRFWEKLPTYGDIALFDRSWYREVSVAREDEALSRRELNHRYDEIVDFEHQITDDGYVLVKFFFHITKKEQKKRFKALEEKKATRWRVTKADWDHNEHYDDYLTAFDEMISRTDRHNAPWTVVAATDRRYATHKVFTTVIAALERDVRQCSDRYRDNFYRDGKLFINNPQREAKVSYPATRPGVCLHPDHFDYFTETYHFKGCLYFCEDCMRKDNSRVELPPVERFSIPSAYLFPIYINAQLLSDSEKRALLDEVVALYRKTGKISSQDRILGYDFGMFLYALADCGDPLAADVYDRMMALRDDSGAWVEYYVDGQPSGCRCRPWESGINIEAAIKYAR